MAVFQFVQPDAGSQSASTYKANIDNSIGLNGQIGNQFAAHEAVTPNMTVIVEGGTIQNGILLVVKGNQTSATITAPTTNPRIDRIVIDQFTGDISVVAGAEAASPVPPAIPIGQIVCCQFTLQTTTTQIVNSLIVDERNFYTSSVTNLDMLVKAETTAENLGLVTTVLNTPTTIATVPSLGPVEVGDVIQVSVSYRHTKGATAGVTTTQMLKGGGIAQITRVKDYAVFSDDKYQVASTTYDFAYDAEFFVSLAGSSIQIKFDVTSRGSAGSVAANVGDIKARVLRKTD